MLLFAPRYYNDFKCTADKCTHSCCIGWEIDVDSDTLELYKALKNTESYKITDSIETDNETGVSYFRLDDNDKCPHLREDGLCNIIINYGEGYLCDICREHPRFYNFTPHGAEVGIGMACEAAARLILESSNYSDIVPVGECDGNIIANKIDTVAERNRIYSILSDKELAYSLRLERLYQAYNVYPSKLANSLWRNIICSLEYLDDAHKSLFSTYTSDINTHVDHEALLERFLAYFIYRHLTKATTKAELSSALGFSFFAERLFASLLKSCNKFDTDEAIKLARIISEELEYSEENTKNISSNFLKNYL